MPLSKERIEALCTDGMYAGVNGDQAEWAELQALALKGLVAPEATAYKRWHIEARVIHEDGEPLSVLEATEHPGGQWVRYSDVSTPQRDAEGKS